MQKKNLTKFNSSGFTLIELLVTLTIFAVTTGIIMTSQSKFDNSVLLTNTAYDIAITLRQAQTYGVNVRESETGATNKFKLTSAYGVHFNTTDGKRFIMFFDDADDFKFDLSNSTCSEGNIECVNAFKIKRGHYIKYLCAGDGIVCDNTNGTRVNNLDISFSRPNPESKIYNGTNFDSKNAVIVISSADDSATRSIVVTKVGQIYVKNN